MPIEILMPALSPTMTEGNLVKWHKKEGETVKAGDVIAEIETDKATMEVEAVDEGSLGKIIVPEGTEGVKVNQLIGLLLEEGEKASALETVKAETLPKPEKKEDSPLPSPETKTELKVIPHQTVVPQDSRMFATPLARRIAEKESLNLESITGSGPRGRIIKADVEQALTQGGMSRSSPPSALLSGYEPTYKVMPTSCFAW